jgi:hydrogenase nickel incorporation protein HypA/HybF
VHELAIMETVVDTVRERLGDAKILRVRLEIGALMAVVPDALTFCFDVCTRGTSMEGAALQIDEVAGDALRIKEVEMEGE